jgi:hypothetical protein
MNVVKLARLSLAAIATRFALLAADLSAAPGLGHALAPFLGVKKLPGVS